MISVQGHSLAAQIVFFVACGFIISGTLLLLYQWRTFLRWSVELMRPFMAWTLIWLGVAIRDTFYLFETASRKVKELGWKIEEAGFNYRDGRLTGGAF